jgi:hypothetical protein
MRRCTITLTFLLVAIGAFSQQRYQIPVVVHILHRGEEEGTGYNFSKDRVVRQIKSLNEDYRRKKNTPGYNNDPNGADSNIEFMLAQVDPDGQPTEGIVRVDITQTTPTPGGGDMVSVCSRFSYWDPNRYLNVWCIDAELPGIFLGSSRFPITDLPGLEDLSQPDGDGVFINALNFGSDTENTDPNYNMGRTLTHEIGHFLGLLHTFGSLNDSRVCDGYTDHCDDTPPIPIATNGCPSAIPIACDGRPVMTGNYMDGSYDACMNIFTRDQVARMRYVLENSPQRASLTTSPVIERTSDIDDPVSMAVSVYPNPVTDKLYLSLHGRAARIGGYTLSGQLIFEENAGNEPDDVGIAVDRFKGQMIYVVVKVEDGLYRFLVNVQ